VIEEPVVAPQNTVTAVGALVAPRLNVDKASVAPALTVISPLTGASATPNVVVPAEIVKLLKSVKVAAGRVLVAPKTTVPVPRVQVCVPVPGAVSAPFIVSVPPAVIVIVLALVTVAFPIAKLLHVKLDPLAKVIVPALAILSVAPTCTAPETVSA
jgi:hypothetical protein